MLGGGSTALGLGLFAASVTGPPTDAAIAAQITVEPSTATGPPSTAVPLPNVPDLAQSLQYDIEQTFRFVADQVAYEPYAGTLRGSQGTLLSLAGNSVDQALLLAALLEEAAVPYRFAIGELTEAGRSNLEASLMVDAAALRIRMLRAYGAPTGDDPGQPPATPPALSAEDEAVVDEVIRTGQSLADAANQRVDQHLALVQDALAEAGVELPPVEATPFPDRELREHVWIQYSDGPSWIDLDPTLPGAAQGDTLAAATTTLDALPEELDHQIVVTIVAEEVYSGAPARRDVVTARTTTRVLQDAPMLVGTVPPSAFESIGLTINQAFTGTTTAVPLIVVGTEAVGADQPIVLGAGNGGGILGGLSGEDDSGIPADGETLALWYRVDLISPDAELVTIERTIFDRIDPVDRLSGIIDLTNLEQIDAAAGDDGASKFAPLDAITLLGVSSGSVSPLAALKDEAVNQFFSALPLLPAAYFALRDGLAFDHGLRSGWHSVMNAPNLTAFRIGTADPEDPANPLQIDIDLLYQARGWVRGSAANSADTVSPWLARGVASQVAEQLLLDPAAWGSAPAEIGIVPVVSAGQVFEQAAAENVPILVIDPASPEGLDTLPAQSRLRIENSLGRGYWVIAPASSVTIDGRDAHAWWLINPETGDVVDQLDDGRSGASAVISASGLLLSPITEYMTSLANTIIRYRNQINCLGNVIGYIFAVAAFLYYGLDEGFTVRSSLIYGAAWGQYFRGLAACAAAI